MQSLSDILIQANQSYGGSHNSKYGGQGYSPYQAHQSHQKPGSKSQKPSITEPYSGKSKSVLHKWWLVNWSRDRYCWHIPQFLLSPSMIKAFIRQVKLKHEICVRGSFFSYETGRHFILNFRIYCFFHHDEAGISKCFCFIWKLWTRWGRYQLQFPNLPTTYSNHVGGAILSLNGSLHPSVFKFCYIYIEKCKKL